MKYILALSLFVMPLATFATPNTKKVCVQETDAKTKKTKEVCKNVKVHKKLEGTQVPPKK